MTSRVVECRGQRWQIEDDASGRAQYVKAFEASVKAADREQRLEANVRAYAEGDLGQSLADWSVLYSEDFPAAGGVSATLRLWARTSAATPLPLEE